MLSKLASLQALWTRTLTQGASRKVLGIQLSARGVAVVVVEMVVVVMDIIVVVFALLAVAALVALVLMAAEVQVGAGARPIP